MDNATATAVIKHCIMDYFLIKNAGALSSHIVRLHLFDFRITIQRGEKNLRQDCTMTGFKLNRYEHSLKHTKDVDMSRLVSRVSKPCEKTSNGARLILFSAKLSKNENIWKCLMQLDSNTS